MSKLYSLPDMMGRRDRITANAKNEAETEAMFRATERARKIIRNPKGTSDEGLRTACVWFMAHGDGGPDYLLADQHLFAIEKRRKIAINRAKNRSALDRVASPHQGASRRAFLDGYNPDRPRPPDRGAVVMIAFLALAGWLGIVVGWILQGAWL